VCSVRQLRWFRRGQTSLDDRIRSLHPLGDVRGLEREYRHCE
jgi:hypothetical protein